MRLLALPLLIALLAIPVRAQQQIAVGGVSLSLPMSWKGPAETDESRAPAWAAYAFNNLNTESELIGARLIICRVTGLDAIERNQWWRGRLPFGYGDSRPVAAASEIEMVFDQARGYRTQGSDRLGTIYFTQHGQAYYAIHISTEADVFEEQLPALLNVARSIQFL